MGRLSGVEESTLDQGSARTPCLLLFHFFLVLGNWARSLKSPGPPSPPLQNEASTLEDTQCSFSHALLCVLAEWPGRAPTFLTNWRSCHFTCQHGLFILSSSLGSQEISSSFRKQAMPLWEYLSCIWVQMEYNTLLYTKVLFIFVHLQVKTTGTDNRFREVLVLWISLWLEVKVSVLSFV